MSFSVASIAQPGTITVAAGSNSVMATNPVFTSGWVGFIVQVGAQWGYVAQFISANNVILDRSFATAVNAQSFVGIVNTAIITQSGTDTSMAALASVPGVDTTVSGTDVTYKMRGLQLRFTGTCTFNPDFEHFVFDATQRGSGGHEVQVSSGGTLNVGSAIVANGYTYYPSGNAFICDKPYPNSGNGFNDLLTATASLYVAPGGTLNYAGGYSRLKHTCFSEGNFNFIGGTIELTGQVRRFSRWGSGGSYNITGGKLIGVELLFDTFPTSVSGVELVNLQGISYEKSDSRLPSSVLSGVTFSGSTADATVWYSTFLELRNSSKGSGLAIMGDTETSNPNFVGVVIATQDVKFVAKTAQGVPISGAVLYIKDTNNGTRYNGFAGYDYTADRYYINTTTGTGESAVFNVLLGEVVKTSSGQVRPFDIRGKTNVPGADLFDGYVWAYGFLPQDLPNTKIQSVAALLMPATPVADTNVTLSEANAVTKLGNSFTVSTTGVGTITVTTSSTYDDVYDALKAWKTRPIQAQLEFPSIGVQPVRASGSDVVTDMNVVVNVGVTLSAGAKFKTLKTTATVTNNGIITGPYTDANNAGQITITGSAATDTVEMRKASDNSLIATRTGSGAFAVSPANVGVSVYFERKVGAVLVMSTQTTPVTLTAGANADVPMFTGSQVQVANLDNVAKETTLQALASTNQTEHDATQSAIAALPAPDNTSVAAIKVQTDKLTFNGQNHVASNIHQIQAAPLADIRQGLATSTNVTAAQTAIIAEVDAIPTNPLLATDSRLNNLDAAISTRSTLTAPQVRTELATELGRLDVAVSTRLAASAYTAPTTAPTAVQIRQEIDANSTKLDVAVGTRLAASAYVSPTAAPTAADNAAAVRTNLTTELARIDATVSSRLPTSSYVAPTTAPTAAQNASAVRTELATELARVDATVSSRLATTGYTAPANADIAAVKAKTDSLTFTQTGAVDANIQYVNDVQVKGTGTESDPWNPQ